MDLTGRLLLAFLEEDDTRRVLFRVRPLLSSTGALSQEDLEELEDDGFLRVAPDRQEQHSFKERMRSLGKLCMIDLRGTETSLGKVRPNKNYAPGRGDSNRYIIYSDAITQLHPEVLYEVVSDDSGQSALTSQYYQRSGGRISGPYCPRGSISCPASQTLMPDCERLFLVEMPDGSSHMFYWPQGGDETAPETTALPAQESPALDSAPEPQETPGVRRFAQAAQSLRNRLVEAGFLLEADEAERLLLLCLISPRVQLLGDSLADARFAAQVLSSFFPEGIVAVDSQKEDGDEADLRLMYMEKLFAARRLKRYLTSPWPVVSLRSGAGFPSLHPSEGTLDIAALLQEVRGSCQNLSPDEEGGLTALLRRAAEEGCALPLTLRGQMAEYLCYSGNLAVAETEKVLEFIRAAYVLPYLQARGYSAVEAARMVSP